jgi:hypothetical protein
MLIDSQHLLHELVRHFAESSLVAAIAVVGSMATGRARPESDLDLFIYADGGLTDVRIKAFAQFANPEQWHSVGERSFGDGDVWCLRDGGPWLDLTY